MALSFDPEALPVVGIDDHLPPVASAELQVHALRRRFAAPPAWSPDVRIENRYRVDARPPADAAVLVALVEPSGGGSLSVLLTRRTDHLTDHPGQISFPGGRVEPEDADVSAAALREAQEEIGLDPGRVDVLGALPTYTTGTGFVVTPVVAVVRPGYQLHPEPGEVAEVFEVPLDFLMNPANHRRHRVEIDGTTREFLSMPWQVATPGAAGLGATGSGATDLGATGSGATRRYFIWGATAAMLRNLYRFLAA